MQETLAVCQYFIVKFSKVEHNAIFKMKWNTHTHIYILILIATRQKCNFYCRHYHDVTWKIRRYMSLWSCYASFYGMFKKSKISDMMSTSRCISMTSVAMFPDFRWITHFSGHQDLCRVTAARDAISGISWCIIFF